MVAAVLYKEQLHRSRNRGPAHARIILDLVSPSYIVQYHASTLAKQQEIAFTTGDKAPLPKDLIIAGGFDDPDSETKVEDQVSAISLPLLVRDHLEAKKTKAAEEKGDNNDRDKKINTDYEEEDEEEDEEKEEEREEREELT
ncbi:MAG: hypothetical protein LQ339_006991, partial [Xanthoria mediterranea]